MAETPEIAKAAVLLQSEQLPENTPTVKGYDFNSGINYEKLLTSYVTSGFQATNLGKAIEEVKKMVNKLILTFANLLN